MPDIHQRLSYQRSIGQNDIEPMNALFQAEPEGVTPQHGKNKLFTDQDSLRRFS